MDPASVLNDSQFVTRLDDKGMFDLAMAFPEQCRKAIAIALQTDLTAFRRPYKLVVLSGLGGSAAGGDFLRGLFEAYGSIPYQVVRDYHMPSYVDKDTLVIACSYSGQTEETLSAYHEAKAKGATILAITSGGTLAERARADGFPVIIIPGGQPPRTALGFMLMPAVVACEKLDLIPPQAYDAFVEHLEQCARQWGMASDFTDNPTKRLAAAMFGKLSVLYGLGIWTGLVANRWKGQINENAKNMTFANTFPELNHNEILGWVQADHQGVDQWVMVCLQEGTESAKMKKRLEVTKQMIAGVAETHDVFAQGADLLQRMVSLAFYGDFVSLYLAALNGVDPENIDSINTLKRELSAIP